MDCYIQGSETVDDVENLPTVAFLSGQAVGKVIWQSKEYTKSIYCKAYSNIGSEDVYIYPLPYRSTQKFPTGVKVGIIINGVDKGTISPNSGSVLGDRIDTDWLVDVKGREKTFTFQTYIIKVGDVDVSQVSDKLTLLQFDGVGGINTSVGAKNYRLSIDGISKVGTVTCSNNIMSNEIFLKNIPTQEVIGGGYSISNAALKLDVDCSSSSSAALASIVSVTGDLTLSGTAFSNNANYFSTGMDNLGLEVDYNGNILTPGESTPVTVPVGATSSINFSFSPHLSSLSPWMFSDIDINPKTNISYKFTVTQLNTN